MASTIPAARTALVESLTALTGTGNPLDGVRVVRTGQWKTYRERSLIAVLNARDIRREPRRLGAQRFDEDYVLPVLIETTASGADLEAIEARLWALVTIVEQTVMADMNLAGTVKTALPAGSPDGETSGPADDNNVMAQITINIDCSAHVDLS